MQYNTIYFSLDALQYNIIHIARDKRKGKDKEDPEKKKREAIESGSTWRKLGKHYF